MTYTLITTNRNYSSWSLRPWVLMKALGIDFTDRVEPFLAPTNYDAFRSFSPTGQVPALIDGELVLNPAIDLIPTSDLDLVVAGTQDALMMVESEAKELSEEIMLGAVLFDGGQPGLFDELEETRRR